LTSNSGNRALAVSLTGYFPLRAGGRAAHDRQRRGGNIINIGSIGRQTSLGRGNFVYGVAKAASTR